MRIERLRERADFLALRRGLFARSDLFSVQVSTRSSEGKTAVRVGFTVTRKVGGAVVRNRIKRRLRAAAREAATDCPCDLAGRDVVIIARRDAADAPFERLIAELRRTVARALQPRRKGGTQERPRRSAP